MGTFLIASKSVLPLFIIILLGILFSKTKSASPKWIDVLNNYALWIGFPALIIASLMKLKVSDNTYTNLIIINSAYIVCSILLVYPISKIFRFSTKMRSSLILVFAFGNVAYLGMPVLHNVFGNPALPIAAIIAAVYLFWMFTLAIGLIEIHETKKFQPAKIIINLLKNPLLLAVLVSILIISFKIEIPQVIEKSIQLFAQSVTALVLFSLGMFLGFQKIGNIKEWFRIFVFALLIILVFPAILFFFLNQFATPSLHNYATIIDAAMPVGITSYVLASRYKLEDKFVARLVVMTTTLSVITLPCWIMITGQ